MHARRFIAPIIACAAWAGQILPTLAGSYSDEQLELAGRIGVAVAQSRICSGTVPTSAVVRALEAGGLTEGDVLGDTPIRARMQHDASAVIAASNEKASGGEPRAAIVKAACDGFRASFGPNGVLVPAAD